ncbi:hypothetical protein QBC46DRAFT_428521 [Diplogelasinospora grovesii]|uniref:Ubiquitin 3 binding protein But2 C-terminal domain-containing protein n=1 Tax=Diplogelasinospora grovesii TaxID=303347 RepID=A0AAN6MVG1_9PEZI|nr:hypothetical protein QBC46DRAFT_428521 [Diplogelasinospora grovesii]
MFFSISSSLTPLLCATVTLYTTTLMFTTLVVTSTVSAAPTGSSSSSSPPNLPTHHVKTNNNNLKRKCSGISYPSLRTSPSQPLPPYSISITTTTTTTTSSSNPKNGGVEIGFTIPEGVAGPCNLMINLPPNAAHVTPEGGGSGGVQIDVFALDGPAPGALVGTTMVNAGEEGTTMATINSFACRPQMCYSLRIANRNATEGEEMVEFKQGGGAEGEQGVGIYMTHDC